MADLRVTPKDAEAFIAASIAYYGGDAPNTQGGRHAFVPKSHGAPEHATSLRVLVNQPWKSFRQASRSDHHYHRELRATVAVKLATTSRVDRDRAIMRSMGNAAE